MSWQYRFEIDGKVAYTTSRERVWEPLSHFRRKFGPERVGAKSARPKGGKAKTWAEQKPSADKLYQR